MKRSVVAVLALAAVVLWLGSAAARQVVQPRPGPGSGIVPVTGTVSIGNVPTVNAVQVGEWKADVRISNMPNVALQPPPFLQKGSRYAVTWAGGERETVSLLEVGPGGWARVDTAGGNPRWINVAAARAVEELE